MAEGHDVRRVVDHLRLAVFHTHQFLERPLVGLGESPFQIGGHLAPIVLGHLVGQALEHLGHIEVGPPHIEGSLRGEERQGLPVALGRQTHGLAAPFVTEAARAPANGDAGHQAFHIPFPMAAGGFVEIVQIEHEVRFRGAVPAEVRDMGIAARLHQKPRGGQGGQIGGHGKGRAAKEGERRGRHAAVPLRHQEGQAIGILLEDEVDRLAAAWTYLPFSQIAARQLLSTGLPLLLGRLVFRPSNGCLLGLRLTSRHLMHERGTRRAARQPLPGERFAERLCLLAHQAPPPSRTPSAKSSSMR